MKYIVLQEIVFDVLCLNEGFLQTMNEASHNNLFVHPLEEVLLLHIAQKGLSFIVPLQILLDHTSIVVHLVEVWLFQLGQSRWCV